MTKQFSQGQLFTRVRTCCFRLPLLALVIACLTAGAWAWLAPTGKAEPALNLRPQERVEAEVIALRPTGFEPAAVRRPAGRALVAVDNGSGLDKVVLRLERGDDQLLHEVRLPRGRKKWRQAVNFTPGTYRLTVAGQPEWVCAITIE